MNFIDEGVIRFKRFFEELEAKRCDPLFDPPPPFPHPPDDTERLIEKAIDVAENEIGHGEEGGDNKGPDIARYCAPMGDRYLWCAAYAGYCYETSAKLLNLAMPFKRSLGARQLGLNMAAVGRKFTDINEARPGDLIVFGRPGGHHVAMFKEFKNGLITSLDGNSGPKVRFVERDIKTHPPKFIASLRRKLT